MGVIYHEGYKRNKCKTYGKQWTAAWSHRDETRGRDGQQRNRWDRFCAFCIRYNLVYTRFNLFCIMCNSEQNFVNSIDDIKNNV